MPSWPAEFREKVALSHRLEWVVRMYYGNETGSNRVLLATAPGITLDGEDYLDVISERPGVRMAVNRQTHSPERGTVSLTINDIKPEKGRRFSEILSDSTKGSGVDIGFENRLVDIRRWTPGVTTWAGCAPVRKMRFRDDEPTDSGQVVVTCQDNSELSSDIKLPITVIDAVSYPGAPSGSIGKRIPLAFGDIDFAPGLLVANYQASPSVFAELAFDDPTYAVDGLYAYTEETGPPTRGPLYIINDGKMVSVDRSTYNRGATQLDDCNIKFTWGANQVRFEEFLQGVEVQDWIGSDEANAIDGSRSTYSGYSAAANWVDAMEVRYPLLGGELKGKLASAYAYAKVYGSVAGSAILDINLQDTASSPTKSVELINLSSPGNATFNSIDGPDSPANYGYIKIDDDISFFWIVSTADTDEPPTGDTAEARMYDLRLRILITTETHDKFRFFAPVKCRKDDGSGTYTGTADALIENPADIIRHIVENDLGATADATAFAAARDARSGWKFAFSESGPIDADTLFSAISKFAGLYWNYDENNNFTIVAIKDTYSDTDVDAEISWNDFISPRFTRTKSNEIYDRVEMRYNPDYTKTGEDQYDTDPAVASHPDTATRYNNSATMNIDCPYIRGATTAGYAASFLMKYHRNPHHILSGGLPAELQDLGFGKIIKITDIPEGRWPRGEDVMTSFSRNGQTIYPYFLIYEDEDGEVVAEQLHDCS